MTMNKDFWKIPWLSRDEKAGIHVFYLSCIRFIVGKYGGSMETDAGMRIASIKIPTVHTAACVDELKKLDLVKLTSTVTQQALSV